MEQDAEVILKPVEGIGTSHGHVSRNTTTREDLSIEYVTGVPVLQDHSAVDVTDANTMVIGQ